MSQDRISKHLLSKNLSVATSFITIKIVNVPSYLNHMLSSYPIFLKLSSFNNHQFLSNLKFPPQKISTSYTLQLHCLFLSYHYNKASFFPTLETDFNSTNIDNGRSLFSVSQLNRESQYHIKSCHVFFTRVSLKGFYLHRLYG